jgi:hypothetical protein
MKKCFKCSCVKPLDNFYQHKGMSDGYLNKCKDCTKKEAEKREKKLRNDPKWVEKEKKRSREKYHRLGYKDKHKPNAKTQRKQALKYREKYPEKYKGKNRTSNMKPDKKGNHLHHWSYNDEHLIDVIELSPKDHSKAHRYLIYDQERKMYRNTENVLLDTRYRHMMYILHVITDLE